MDKSIDILTIGDLCADVILSGDGVVPEFGQKEKLIDDYDIEMGGSCSIFACQAAKLGLRTVMIGKIGCDPFGEVIYETMKSSGVDTRYVIRDPASKTGVTVILNTGKDRAMLTYTGTIDAVGRADVPEEILESVRHLHIGSYFLIKKIQPFYPEIIKKVKKCGGTISLDTNWDPAEKWDDGLWDILPYIDIFFPNENEIKAITRRDSLEKAVAELEGMVPIIAIKKGEDGAEVHTDGKVYYAKALPVKVADTVGAGDSFDAGFLYGYLGGASVQECAQFGCICGSLNARMAGGTKGQPKLEELLSYK
jgi:sugar/nucleoside kinase (ribokinase family)